MTKITHQPQSITIKYRIRQMRINAELSRPAMAKKLSMSPSTLKNYELGYRYPSTEFIENVGRILGVETMLYVLGFGSNP